MPWQKKSPDLTNNPLYLEPRVTANETSLAESTKKISYFVTPEQYVDGQEPEYWDDILSEIIAEAKASNTGYTVNLQSKVYKFQNTIDLYYRYMSFVGGAVGYTQLEFHNTVLDKPFLLLNEESSATSFANITFKDINPGTSIGIKLTDKITAGIFPNWYNQFSYCRWLDFKVGANFTTENPLDGSTHTHLDSTMFLHCKFTNCRTTFLNQNIQAVNLNLFNTDVENSDPGETYTFIRDEAGSSMNIFGGSWIGKGKLFEIYRATSASNIFAGSRYSFHGTRFEARTGHIGTFIDMLKDANSAYNVTISLALDFDKCNFLLFNQTIRFNRTMRANITVSECNVLTGGFQVYDTPTAGINSTDGGGSTSCINISKSGGFSFVAETSSVYGTYNKNYSSIVNIQNNMTASSNSVFSTDSLGFYVPNTGISSYNNLGYRLNVINNKIIFNNNYASSGFKDVKMTIPYNARPLTAICYKHPTSSLWAITYNVYIVKDNSYWVNPAAFDYTTDAILAATLDTTGKAGYFTAPIQITSTAMGSTLQAGITEGVTTWTWNEGRMYFRHSGSTSNFGGFVGVEYI